MNTLFQISTYCGMSSKASTGSPSASRSPTYTKISVSGPHSPTGPLDHQLSTSGMMRPFGSTPTSAYVCSQIACASSSNGSPSAPANTVT